MSRSEAGVAPAGVAASADRPIAARLARGASRGERKAFEAIFRRYHQELYRYCLAIVRDREDAEDALQATMAATLRALPGEKRDLALRPWLYRVAHNESISVLRGRTPGTGGEDLIEATGASAASDLEQRERLRQLVADLRELPERQRSAIVMRELNDLSYADIGEALQSSEGAARQAVYEARGTLFAFREGREMECEPAREAISSRDGRRLRGHRVRAHLRTCEGCRDYEALIDRRRSDLQVLCPPLPAVAATTLLSGLLGGSGGAAGIAGVGVGGAGVGGVGALASGIAASTVVKGASVIAAAALAAGAADLGGVIDLPTPIGGRDDPAEAGGGTAPSGPDSGQQGTGTRASAGGSGTGASNVPALEAASDNAADTLLPGLGSSPPLAKTGGKSGGASGGTSGGEAGGNPDPTSPTAPVRPGRPEAAAAAPPAGSAAAPPQTESGPPGKSEPAPAPGSTGSSPGNSGSAPGHSGTGSPGKSGSAPGHTGSSPGKSGSAGPKGGSSDAAANPPAVPTAPAKPDKPDKPVETETPTPPEATDDVPALQPPKSPKPPPGSTSGKK